MAFHITALTMLQAPLACEMFSFTSSGTLDCDTLPVSSNRKLAIGVASVAPVESIRRHSTSAYGGSPAPRTRTNSTRDPPCTTTIRSAVGSWATRSPRRSGRPSPACSANLANERNKLRITDVVALSLGSTFFFAAFFTCSPFPISLPGPKSNLRRFSWPLLPTATGRRSPSLRATLSRRRLAGLCRVSAASASAAPSASRCARGGS
jgi:hypothetical protein